MSFSSGEKGNVRSLPGGYSILPRTISVGRSILSAVGIRNSDLGVFELIWNPEATRKLSGTLVCVARATVTVGTGAIDTDGALPNCAQAEQAESKTRKANLNRRLGEIIAFRCRRPR